MEESTHSTIEVYCERDSSVASLHQHDEGKVD